VRKRQRLVAADETAEGLSVRARLAVWYAVVRIGQGKLAEGAAAAAEGIALARRAGDEPTLAQAFVTADFADAALGRSVDDARTRDALEIYARLGDLRGEATAANQLGASAYYAGRWEEAGEQYRRSRDARERMGDLANAAVATANLAELLVERGHGDDAEADLVEAEGLWMATGDVATLAFSRRLRGLARARRGDHGEAAALLDRARADFAAMGARGEVAATDVALAELALLAGDRDRALALLDAVVEADLVALGGHHLLPSVHRLRGLALVGAGPGAGDGGDGGDEAAATAELEQALAVARVHGADHEVALVLDALGAIDRRAGRPVDAARDAERATIVARLGMERRLAGPAPAPRPVSGSAGRGRRRSGRGTASGSR
jgi:tetratricopeptide (TPR) repeat protein